MRQSTRLALKYRSGKGEIIIVNHHGRGWRDPTGSTNGDVLSLVQHLDPSLNFSAVRKVLRSFVSIIPASTPADPTGSLTPVSPTAHTASYGQRG